MPRHLISDVHERINDMSTVVAAKTPVVSNHHINMLPSHVSASHESRLTVSKPGRSQKFAWKARNFSEQCGVKTP